MNVINCIAYRDNPYNELLYCSISDRYQMLRGSVDDAIEQLDYDKKAVLHIHWEEHLIRASPTTIEANAAVDYFARRLTVFVQAGGIVLWTVHNGLPHELEHIAVFLRLRALLGELSNRIIVHNLETIDIISDQFKLDRSKVFFLPHPSYLDVYEPIETAKAVIGFPPERKLIAFGKIRRYKAIDRLTKTLTPDFLERNNTVLHISGAPIKDDNYVAEVRQGASDHARIIWDVRSIPDQEVPTLLRSACAVVLSYERFLTSGVALLALSVGAIVIGPAIRQLLEILPSSAHRFLFEPGSNEDMLRVIGEVLELTDDERISVRRSLLARAQYFHPRRISNQLGDLLDNLRAG